MKKKSGRITLRVDPALHRELAVIADRLGLELNELLVKMIDDALPTYRAQATEREFHETLAVLPGGKSPLVKIAMDAGRWLQDTDRVQAMVKAVAPLHNPKEETLAAILAAALHELQKEDEMRAMEKAIADFYESVAPPDEDLPEGLQ
jgi:hypothetical protein